MFIRILDIIGKVYKLNVSYRYYVNMSVININACM